MVERFKTGDSMEEVDRRQRRVLWCLAGACMLNILVILAVELIYW